MTKINLNTQFLNHQLKNPVWPASGTFGMGTEFCKFFNLNILGAVVLKSVTWTPRFGNPLQRVTETTGGMLNSIGLQNDGIKNLPIIIKKLVACYQGPIIVSIAPSTTEELLACLQIINSIPAFILAIEIDVSCPNVGQKQLLWQKTGYLGSAIALATSHTKFPLIIKLSPQFGDLVPYAKICESAGAKALTLINTLRGLAINPQTRQFKIANRYGGLSGPAIKPIALASVYAVHQSVKIPIIGVGGISNAADVVEFLLAGATCVQIGSANFQNPLVMKEIISDLPAILQEMKYDSISKVKPL